MARSVAVIGGGISGLGAAYELAKAGVHVVLYEKQDSLGGHAKTVTVDGIELDLHFMAFNRVTHPNLTELIDNLGLDVEECDMSFSMSLDNGHGCEWGSRNGLRNLFAQKSNAVNPNFWKMIQEMKKFEDDVIMYLEDLENNPDLDHTETLADFIKSRGYTESFQMAYLVPMCASIWSCSPDKLMNFSSFSVLSFCLNHHLLQLFNRPQWLAVKGRSTCYVNKLKEELEVRGCQIRTSCEVHSLSTSDAGCTLVYGNGSEGVYDRCVIAVPAPDAVKILGTEATYDEVRILGAFQYICSDSFLHRDKNFMPQNPAVWSAWNFVGSTDTNVFDVLAKSAAENVLLKWSTSRVVPSVAAAKALLELDNIQGKRQLWFCGRYHGYGTHEDGLKAGMTAAHSVLGRSFKVLSNTKQMVPSWAEAAARHIVTRFFRQYISAGFLTMLEEGGTVMTFGGSDKRCTWKATLRVHNPRFYWKVATDGDIGFADAYVDGDISVVDKNNGLLDFFMVFLANSYLYPSASLDNEKRGWLKPMLFTAGIASARYFFQHVSRRNSVTLSRQNIARHYDLSNEMFSLFLDETMTYSCAVFKSENEDLKVAQLRKIHLLIDKAKIEKHHELLDIGCGWGSLAIEAVKKTGCRYTGITLAEEQLKLAQQRVKEAGLEDRMRFLLCDYRQLPTAHKYDRIISCGMLEHVGDEYYEDFFRHSDLLLGDNGLLVLQFISMPDQWYEGHRKRSDFMREYIFPGGCLPSLNRLTSAMTTSSRLCIEHVENIGIHYYQTLRCWRKNFLENKSKIRSLGFDDKFIRTWEYYFDYCAAGFKTRTVGDYQIVLSRPGNLAAFSDPYEGIPSSHSIP